MTDPDTRSASPTIAPPAAMAPDQMDVIVRRVRLCSCCSPFELEDGKNTMGQPGVWAPPWFWDRRHEPQSDLRRAILIQFATVDVARAFMARVAGLAYPGPGVHE